VRRSPRPAGLALVLALAAGLTAGCDRHATPADRVVVAIASSPVDLDPRVGVDEASQRVHQLLYSSLFRLDAQLQVVPDLAESWTMPDAVTYLVRVRDGVRFHDGRELTAEDVAFTFRSFLDPDFLSARKGAYTLLASVRATGRYEVAFTLKEPFGSFPINLVMGIVPAGTVRSAPTPVGSGPYALEWFARDDRVVLRRFDEYFDGAARNPGVVLKVVPDDTMRGLELRKGTVDLVVNDIAPDIAHQFELEGRLRFVTAPGADYAYLGLNLRDPVLQDVRVRHALAHAIDRDAIVEHLRRGLARPAIGILAPMSWAFEPEVPVFTYDPARARRLLDEAGHPDPDGDGPLPRFGLTVKTSTAEFVRLQAAVIQQQLREVGIALDVRSHELATLLQDVSRGNFQMFTLQWVGVSDPDMLRRVFHSGQVPPVGFNRGFFIDPGVDALLDAASRATDEEERRALYGAVQRRVAGEAPYISLWWKTNVAVHQPHIEGVTLSPTAEFGFVRNVVKHPPETTRAPGSPGATSRDGAPD
jgi:peptide/nickel transport system substrate-binding protein